MDIKSKIESLLFISGSSLAVSKIANLIKIKNQEAKKALDELKEEYASGGRGLAIAAVEDKYQMVTSSENAEMVQSFVKEEVIGELTRPQLEALTVIAYRGPITKIELEQIRGVNCSLILRNLLIRGLIETKAEKDGLERYVVTHDFLKYLGIVGTEKLPDYEKLNKDKNLQDLAERMKERK